MDSLAQDAIRAALAGSWDDAISLNQQILEKDKDNIDAYLRLANACFESGRVDDAHKHATKALTKDPESHLAKRWLERCGACENDTTRVPSTTRANLKAFLETPGKTRLVHLNHLGEPKILVRLHPGEQLNMNAASRKASIESSDGTYIGRLPDDVASHVSSSKNSQFWVALKKATPSEVLILLHES